MSISSRLSSARREEERLARERSKFIDNPVNVDNWIAGALANQLPEDVKPAFNKHATKADAIDAAFSRNDPRRGMANEIKTTFDMLATAPEGEGFSGNQLLEVATAFNTAIREEDTHRYTRDQQASLFGGEKVRPLPGFDEWVSFKRAEEAANPAEFSATGAITTGAAFGGGLTLAKEGLARSGTIQKGIKAIAGAIRPASKLAARGLIAAPHPLAKIAGAAALAAIDFLAFEKVAEVVENSEWGRAKQQEGTVDKVDVAEFLLGAASGAGAHKLATKATSSLIKSAVVNGAMTDDAMRLLERFPTAENAINAGRLIKTSRSFNAKHGAEVEELIASAESKAAALKHEQRIAGIRDEISAKSGELGAINAEVQYGGAGAKKVAEGKKIADELDALGAELGEPVEAASLFRNNLEIGELSTRKAKVDGMLKKATKAGDESAIQQLLYENKLIDMRLGELAGGRKPLSTIEILENEIDVLNKRAGKATGKSKAKILAEKAKKQEELDAAAGNKLGKMTEEEVETVTTKIEAGKTPAAAIAEVEEASAIAAEVANVEENIAKKTILESLRNKLEAKATTEMSNKAIANQVAKEETNAVAETLAEVTTVETTGELANASAKDIATVIEQRVAGKAVTKAARDEATARAVADGYTKAELKGIKTAEEIDALVASTKGTTAAQRRAGKKAVTPAEIVAEDTAAQQASEAVELPRHVVTRETPFAKVVAGEMTPAEYAELVRANPNILKAETDWLYGKKTVVDMPTPSGAVQEQMGKKFTELQREVAKLDAANRPTSEIIAAENMSDTKLAQTSGALATPRKFAPTEEFIKHQTMAAVKSLTSKDALAAAKVAEQAEREATIKAITLTGDELEKAKAEIMARRAEQGKRIDPNEIVTNQAALDRYNQKLAVGDLENTELALKVRNRDLAKAGMEIDTVVDDGANLFNDERGATTLGTLAMIAGPTALGILLLEGITPTDANAMPIAGRVVMGAVKYMAEESGVTGKELMDKVVKQYATPVVAVGQKVLGAKTNTLKIAPAMPTTAADAMVFQADRWLLSPHIVGEYHYKGLQNPSVIIANKITAAQGDTDAAKQVLNNILSGVRGMDTLSTMNARREIRAAFKPLEQKYSLAQAESGYNTGMIEGLEKRLKDAEKKMAKRFDPALDGEIATLNEHLTRIKSRQDALKPMLEQFSGEWEGVAKQMAAKHPSTRIALAAEDSATFEQMPWLASMLSREEKEAVGYIKNMMQEFAGRIESVGGKAIKSRDFMHHAMHPDKDLKGLKALYGTISHDIYGAPAYSKLFQRALGSRQMMPEITYAMDRYLPDINKRIHMMEFWKQEGWGKHANEASMRSEGLKNYWDAVKGAFKPHEPSWSNNFAHRYQALEVTRLLALSPSVAFKHLIKVSATLAGDPLSVTIPVLPKSIKAAVKIGLNRHWNDSWLAKATGTRISLTEQEQLIDSFTRQGHYLQSIADMELNAPSSLYDYVLGKINSVGSAPVRSVELFDRAHTILASMEMGARKGMTPQQSLEATFKTILQNNFLGGSQNSAFLRNPKVRALMMFQGTPFKIAERRLLVASRTKDAAGEAAKLALQQMGLLKRTIKEGEQELKASMIWDALMSERDQFGTPYARIMMKEMMILGAFVVGGREALNVDFFDHVFHPPLATIDTEAGNVKVAFNPAIQSFAKTQKARMTADEDEFWMSTFFQTYLKGSGTQATLNKALRLSENDIPERYLGAADPNWAYFFSVPAHRAE